MLNGRQQSRTSRELRYSTTRSKVIELANDLSSNGDTLNEHFRYAPILRQACRRRTLRVGPFLLAAVLSCLLAIFPSERTHAFTYHTAGGLNPIDTVVHPGNYYLGGNANPGHLTITVGVKTGTAHADEMMISVQNVVNQWNWLTATTGNLDLSLSNGVPAGKYDFESVLLHEFGHALGLSHPELASDSGLVGNDQEYTRSTTGLNGVYDLDAGVDGVIGTADDVRGDDENLGWFNISSNDPFALPLAGNPIDSTTYSRDLSDLPVGDSYAAVGNRNVGNATGYANTEAVMQQGSVPGEMQRMLTADDTAGIRYGMSGVDELAGTADDYWLDLQFVGQTFSADIMIDFDNASTNFAETSSLILWNLPDNHKAAYKPKIRFNDANHDWHFNDTLYEPLFGDVDLNGLVDVTDILTAFSNFTGPGTVGATRSDGDVEGDRDVDVSDILDIFSAFGSTTETLDQAGSFGPAAAGDPNAPDLIYDAATGEVILDPEGRMIRGYSLTSGGAFLDQKFTAILGGVSSGNASELSEAVFGDGFDGITSPMSIGNVLPGGLTYNALLSLLGNFEASMELGSSLEQFDLVVLNAPLSVPEPSTWLLGSLAMLGMLIFPATRSRQPRRTN